MDNSTLWKIINRQFEDNPQSLVTHHIESYNDFFKNGIYQIFKEKNPLILSSNYDESIDDYRYQCIMYFGGKDGSKIHFGKPVIYDDANSHYMFPNEARIRNMTYGMTVHYDVDVEFVRILKPGEEPTTIGLENVIELSKGGEIQMEHDYLEERAEYLQQKAGNFKENALVDIAEFKKHLDEFDGGAKTTKPATTKAKTGQVKMTPNLAAMVRQINEEALEKPNVQRHTITLDKIYLGKFPIMLQSDFCVLSGLERETRYSMGECRNDIGGYFIISGKEKTVIPQEKFADNMLYIRHVNDEEYLYSAEIRSVSENVSKPIRTLSVKMQTPSTKYSNNNIVVNIPNVRKPIPLFIVFRALGIISDKDIITTCLLDIEKYDSMVDLFIPSVHEACGISNQQTALKYIASFTKINTVTYVLEILSDYFLPHVGELNYIQKAYYLGYIVFRLLSVYTGLESPTDRDNFKYKRIELVGSLIYDLFREYYNLQQKQIHLEFEKRLYYNKKQYEDNLVGLIMQNYREVFKDRIVEVGFNKAFKGNWGAQTHTKRVGIVQDLNRLSFNTMLSHLRKTNLPLDSGVKLVGPRVLHTSQWGFIDPIDTPDGGNIGLHKHLAISTYVSRGISREPMIQWLREKTGMKLVEECAPIILANMTRVMVNGLWAGSVSSPLETIKMIKLFRRNALLPIHTSATFNIRQNTIYIYTDAGRLCRPIFYVDEQTGKLSFEDKTIMKKLESGEFTWNHLISGFNEKRDPAFRPNDPKIVELYQLYKGVETETNPAKLERFLSEKAIIDYIDPSESEDAFIAFNSEEIDKEKKSKHTHLEIHESLGYGMMGNQIIFPENNPPVRNSFSCGQSKQAVSMYHTNFHNRMDKSAVLLNSGQIPIVKSRYMEHINHEENPYGENAIVAIMCYTGYNVEDAILINEGALKRGLFRTTYYTTYEAHEESSKNASTLVDKRFTNIESEPFVVGTKTGYDYSKLDKTGLIRENTQVDDKTVLIGLTSNSILSNEVRVDQSKTPKKGQLGIVDKTYITEGEEGERIAKIRIREERIPNLGDKMASRSGQKGTIGMVIPECDMPFTRDGIRPDLIINPHAIPTRMTIGQLVECIIGKASVMYGGFSDCTAFNNKGSKIGVFGEYLAKAGFHSSGNEILYNGMTGEQLETEIFMGPTYYMRLKHMVKDKINYRATGPRTALTKQPVSGRANDGGLRIGEMERDVLISHGITNFLRESMMERGDKYQMAVCNKSGMIAIYNPSKNLFMSPMADGPIQFTGSLDGKDMRIENVTKFGRDFSIVSIPYSLKLLLQELQTTNVQMRIITEDNIHQLESMSFSKNIQKLTHNPNATHDDIIIATKEAIMKSRRKVKPGTPLSVEDKAIMQDDRQLDALYNLLPESPPYAPTSPAYDPNYSPPYAPGSPAYDPNSPVYAPGSPAYDPTSPVYDPNLPVYDPNLPVYDANSPPYPPAYYPLTPDQSPPDQINGGSTDFQRGESVFLRGGKKSNREWKIRNIGDNFVTIGTDDMEGIDDFDDSIQVVSMNDIYRPSDIQMHQPAQHIPMYNDQQMPINHANTMFDHDPSKINFTPVFNIVTGNDNTIDSVPNATSSQYPGNDIPIVPDTNDIYMGGKKEKSKKAEIPPNDSNVIDFSKGLIIKKI
jgi:DNA-directed RNA polymerase II subunit RPB2